MDIPLSSLGRLGRQPVPREGGDHVREQLDRIHESALRRPRVDADALDREPELVRGEGLDLELAEPRPVERVGEVGAEGVEIEVVGALAHLLVDRERDARRGARCIIVEEVRDRRHDHGDARLVVCAEERRAVARDQVLPDPLGEGGHVCRIEDLRLVARQRIGSPDQARWTIGRTPMPGGVRGRVDVRDEADPRRSVDGAGERREDVARLGELDVGDPERASSSTRCRQRSSCFSVDGYVGESTSACVSITT